MTILTAILVVITGIYAYLTYRMAQSSAKSVAIMDRQVDAISRPYVSVGPMKKAQWPWIYLKIENTGQTEAKNLRLQIDATPETLETLNSGMDVTSAHAFNHPLSSFAPGAKLFYLLGSGDSLESDGSGDAKLSPTFTVTATYTFGTTEVSETTTVDVNQFRNTVLETDQIVRAIDDLKNKVDELGEQVAKSRA